KTREFFLLFGMGSQTDGLIYMRLASLGVYCQLADPATMRAEDVRKLHDAGLIGIVISGGPKSVYSQIDYVSFDSEIFDLKIPIFGICLGFQMWANWLGATVKPSPVKEYNPVQDTQIVDKQSPLLAGLPKLFKLAQNHGDVIEKSPVIYVTAFSEQGFVAVGESAYLHGIQGHPEMSHTEHGQRIFENFCFGICGAKDRFPAENVAVTKIAALRAKIGKNNILIALSGGVDSSVAAELVHHAVGSNPGQVSVVYIKGLDRDEDEEFVRKHFKNQLWCELTIVDATSEFLEVLVAKETGPEKRQAMKGAYARILEREIRSFGAKYIVQGTNYADLSESAFSIADLAENGIELSETSKTQRLNTGKATQKVHHNTNNNFSVPEIIPLADMVKDGIRDVGRSIGVAEELLTRHPFPGVGLAARIDGEVTAPKLAVARAVDRIWNIGIRVSGKYGEIWQAGADILRSTVTCTKGEEAQLGVRVVLWARTSVNAFSARPYPFDPLFIEQIAVRIASKVREVGSVSYEYMPKPPKHFEQI
ncbi:MAG: hypothetical protein Q7S86_00800, partial [bacterium]|nr:hypothetical protein [bacterium]